MKMIGKTGREDIAIVYVIEFEPGELVECVESLSPPQSREEKWVLLVSTLYGCPVECAMCDAGGYYHGKIPADKIFAQIDFLVQKRYPDLYVPCKQFKIQFSRMGEPAYNPAVLEVLKSLPDRYHAPGLMPSLSTVAPNRRDAFFERLIEVKNQLYSKGRFQFQFSIHTTDEELRRQIIPVKTWDFAKMAAYGERFCEAGDRKITLNFALANGNPVDLDVLLRHFNPQKFLIKITPLNPTYKAQQSGMSTYINPKIETGGYKVVENLKNGGYQVIVSVGETEENLVGSNCGQYVLKHLNAQQKIKEGYTYKVGLN